MLNAREFYLLKRKCLNYGIHLCGILPPELHITKIYMITITAWENYSSCQKYCTASEMIIMLCRLES